MSKLQLWSLMATLVTTMPAQAQPTPELTIHQNESRRIISLEYGPLHVPAATGYTGEMIAISVEASMPVNGWLRSFAAELTSAEGRRITEPLLHHAGLFSPNRRDLFGPAMERVVAFGQETEKIRLPGQLGYRVEAGDVLLLLGALYNTGPQPRDSLFLRVEMVYADARWDVRHTDVLPLYLDVMPPGNRVYDVPPGRSSRSRDWSPAIDGRIVGLGGHLHQHGELLVLDVDTANPEYVRDWHAMVNHEHEMHHVGAEEQASEAHRH